MKRSKTLTLTAAMIVGGGMTISACGVSAPNQGAAEVAASGVDEGRAYASPEECNRAGEEAPGACDAGWSAATAEHNASAPAFANRQDCETQFGAEQCQSRGSSFVPLLAGFFIGRALTGGGRFGGAPFYRDPAGRAVTAGGRPLGPSAFQARPSVRGGSAVTARGGFGGGGRGSGG